MTRTEQRARWVTRSLTLPSARAADAAADHDDQRRLSPARDAQDQVGGVLGLDHQLGRGAERVGEPLALSCDMVALRAALDADGMDGDDAAVQAPGRVGGDLYQPGGVIRAIQRQHDVVAGGQRSLARDQQGARQVMHGVEGDAPDHKPAQRGTIGAPSASSGWLAACSSTRSIAGPPGSSTVSASIPAWLAILAAFLRARRARSGLTSALAQAPAAALWVYTRIVRRDESGDGLVARSAPHTPPMIRRNAER
jgi:hypothetical protein